MDPRPEILVADRNPHIRRFLKRELAAAGYHVRAVENGKQLLALVYSGIQIDLLVLDPDFPCRDAIDLSRRISARIPQLPVVLHCVGVVDEATPFDGACVAQVQKNGNSVEILKQRIRSILSGIRKIDSANRAG